MGGLIPLGDASRPPTRFAVVTILIIVLNAWVFMQELTYGDTQSNTTVFPSVKNGGKGLTVGGSADPAAPARLANEQGELDAAAAQRRVEEEIAAGRREELIRLHLEAEAEQAPTAPLADYPDVAYGSVYGPSKGHAHRRGSPSKQHEESSRNLVHSPRGVLEKA